LFRRRVSFKDGRAFKTRGWVYIAKEMGIKPGSAEFNELIDQSRGNSSKGKGNSKRKK